MMNGATALIDRMFEAWNDAEPSALRRHLEAALTPDVHFVDPTVDVRGLDDYEANVRHVHEQIPGATYVRASAVDEHHGYLRYHWAIHLDGQLVLAGFDVAHIAGDGRIDEVIGFFGPLDAAPTRADNS
jgi:hypothetical protein